MADPYGYFQPPETPIISGNQTPFGQGPGSPRALAGAMPTASDYYFGGGGGAAPTSMPTMGGNPRASWSEGLPWADAPASRVSGGGGSINLGDNVYVPEGRVGQRYRSLLSDPTSIQADPYFQFLQQSGEQALGRSAGARRMRFAGKTMLDFQKEGQGRAAGYLQQLLPQLQQGAQHEYNIDRQNVLGRRTEATMKAFQADPYGQMRNLAAKYGDPYTAYNALYSSSSFGRPTNAPSFEAFQQNFNTGKQLQKDIWG